MAKYFNQDAADIDRLKYEIVAYGCGRIDIKQVEEWADDAYKLAQTTTVSNTLYIHGKLREIRMKVAMGDSIEEISAKLNQELLAAGITPLRDNPPPTDQTNG